MSWIPHELQTTFPSTREAHKFLADLNDAALGLIRQTNTPAGIVFPKRPARQTTVERLENTPPSAPQPTISPQAPRQRRAKTNRCAEPAGDWTVKQEIHPFVRIRQATLPEFGSTKPVRPHHPDRYDGAVQRLGAAAAPNIAPTPLQQRAVDALRK